MSLFQLWLVGNARAEAGKTLATEVRITFSGVCQSPPLPPTKLQKVFVEYFTDWFLTRSPAFKPGWIGISLDIIGDALQGISADIYRG